MSDQVGIGKLIEHPVERDAIHIAVAPVTANSQLCPGDRIGFVDGGNVCMSSKNIIGIVDPFLELVVEPGQSFYMFLLPNTVTSLRHHWAHPAFAVEPVRDVSASEIWLREFATEAKRPYEELLEIGRELLDGGSPCVGDENDQDTFNAVRRLFIHHASMVLGIPPIDSEDAYFRCAC